MIDPTQTIPGIEKTSQLDYSAGSLSSYLMREVTLIRNEILIGAIFAAAAYPVIALVAIVESSVALLFAALSTLISPVFPSLAERTYAWLKSSTFCIGWSSVDAILNLFVVVLIADEQSARKLAMQERMELGGILGIPQGALIYRTDLK